MKKEKSMKVNALMNAVLTMSSFVFPLITFPYVSRILGPEGMGRVTFATAVMYYFAMFAQLGIPTYGIRVCAAIRDDKEKLSRTVQEIVLLNTGMTVLVYGVFFIALLSVPRFADEKLLLTITSVQMILNVLGMEWLYKALEQYTYITVRSIVFKLAALIFTFLLIHTKDDYVIYGVLTIFAVSASNVMNFLHVHKYIDFRKRGTYHFRPHLKPIMVFFAMSIATTIYTNLDNVMLGFMKTNEEVGFYNAAVKIKNILVSVVTSLGVVLLPRASYYVEHGMKEEFERISEKALRFVFLTAVPMVFYFTLFAREGILFLSGSEYMNSILPMQIIMPTVLLIGLTNIMGIQILVPLGKENQVLISVSIGAVTDLIINCIFIPEMASAGAALGTLAAEAVVWVVQLYFLRHQLKKAYKRLPYLKTGCGLILGSICSMAAKYLPLGDRLSSAQESFVVLMVSAVLFFGIYFVCLLAMKEETVTELSEFALDKVKCY